MCVRAKYVVTLRESLLARLFKIPNICQNFQICILFICVSHANVNFRLEAKQNSLNLFSWRSMFDWIERNWRTTQNMRREDSTAHIH